MNKIITLLILGIVIVFSSCDLVEWKNATEYKGVITMTYTNDVNNNTSTHDYDIHIKLTDGKFKKINAEGKSGCSGTFSENSSTFNFNSSECSCWCDCAPNIDCGGDLILGEFEIVNKTATTLELLHSLTREYNGNQFTEEKIVKLEIL